MPSDAATALADIAEHIALAAKWAGEHTLVGFTEDRKTFYAVTRCLAIISEAVRRLPPEMTARAPDIPWAKIRAAGNIYRHQYDDVLEKDVWDTVHGHLPNLAAFVTRERKP